MSESEPLSLPVVSKTKYSETRDIIPPDQKDIDAANNVSGEPTKKSFLDRLVKPWVKKAPAVGLTAAALATPSVVMAQEQPSDTSITQEPTEQATDDDQYKIPSSDTQNSYNQSFEKNMAQEQVNQDPLQSIANLRGALLHDPYKAQYLEVDFDKSGKGKFVFRETPGHEQEAGKEIDALFDRYGIPYDVFYKTQDFTFVGH